MVDNSNKFADKFKLKSSRLINWNYSIPGFYFITIRTLNHNNFFGKIINNKIELSKRGEITKFELLKTFEIRKNIKLHEWVIMPNHIHILMEIKHRIDSNVETPRGASLQNQNNNLNPNNNQNTKLNQNNNLNQPEFNSVETPRGASLHQVSPVIVFLNKNYTDFFVKINIKSKQQIPLLVNQFKSSVKRICNKNNLFFGWQTRFYDQIIENKEKLLIIRKYIQNNLENWQKDKYFNLIKVKN